MMDKMGGIKNQAHTFAIMMIIMEKVIGFGCLHPDFICPDKKSLGPFHSI